MIIAVTGTPGVGKTKVAKKLSKRLKYKIIELNKLADKTNAYCGYDKKRECKIVDVDKLKKEVRKLKGNYIIESHYSHDMPCDLVILLKTDIKELRKRLKSRKYRKEKIDENILVEIFEIIKQEIIEQNKKYIEIDTTKISAAKAITLILKVLKTN